MNDLIERLFASPQGAEALSWIDVAIYMLMAFVLAQLVAWVYSWTHRGVSYSRAQMQSIILMALIVAAVMLAIGSNIARAFGLFGALALIRFRTPIKDVRDTVFLFMAVAIGIMLGTRNLSLALIATGAFSVLALYLSWFQVGQRLDSDAMLRVALPADAPPESLLQRILKHYCQNFALVHLRPDLDETHIEFAYQIRLFDSGQASGLLKDVRAIPGVTGIHLHVRNEGEEV